MSRPSTRASATRARSLPLRSTVPCREASGGDDLGAQVVAGAVVLGTGVAEADDEEVGGLARPRRWQGLVLGVATGRRRLGALGGFLCLFLDRHASSSGRSRPGSSPSTSVVTPAGSMRSLTRMASPIVRSVMSTSMARGCRPAWPGWRAGTSAARPCRRRARPPGPRPPGGRAPRRSRSRRAGRSRSRRGPPTADGSRWSWRAMARCRVPSTSRAKRALSPASWASAARSVLAVDGQRLRVDAVAVEDGRNLPSARRRRAAALPVGRPASATSETSAIGVQSRPHRRQRCLGGTRRLRPGSRRRRSRRRTCPRTRRRGRRR